MNQKNGRTAGSEYIVHVVPHTHWDREWYLPFQHFRIRLVRLIDRLIRLLDEEEYPSYHFDGQTIVLEDYLEIKPHRRAELERLVASGRIEIGPWYVMPDEFLVSGEAIVRNLLLGREQARGFGRSIDVGYLPDIFGHISQMPQILKGFGIDNVMFWRGISGEPDELKSEFVWQGADGTAVQANHLPIHAGYSNALDLPKEREALIDRIRKELDILSARSTTNQLLLMNGTDHTVPQEELPQLIDWMNEHFGTQYRFVPSTVEQYVDSVKGEIGEVAKVTGELRETNHSRLGHHNFVLPNVLSSRMYLKLANERAQLSLERLAEPLSAWASLYGFEYPRELLRQSWKYVLQNHPHDSICGCSVDEVHDENEGRFAWSRQISEQMAWEAMRSLAKQVDTSKVEQDSIPLHVFNPLLSDASGVVEAEVLFPEQADWRDLQVLGPDGQVLSCVVLERRKRAVAKHAYDMHPAIPYWQAAKLRFRASGVPGQGYATYVVKPRNRRTLWKESLFVAPGVLENEYVRLEVQRGGTLSLLDKETGRSYHDLHQFEDGGDRGDGYIYSPPMHDRVYGSKTEACRVSVVADTNDFATLRLEWNWDLPESLFEDRNSRSQRSKTVHIATEVTLTRGSKRVEFETTVENTVQDHRLRVLFPTGIDTEDSRAGSQFDTVSRNIRVRQPADDVRVEEAPTTFPMQGFVDVSERNAGLAFLGAGLTEYELSEDRARTLSVTLLRSVGHLGSPDPLTMTAGAGPALETPGSQCLRKLEYRYALLPHAGSAALDEVLEHSDAFRNPLVSHQGEAGREGSLPGKYQFLKTHGRIRLSALKAHERRDTMVMRIYNPTEQAEPVDLEFSSELLEVYETDLEENRLRVLPSQGKKLRFETEPKRIVTLELKMEGCRSI